MINTALALKEERASTLAPQLINVKSIIGYSLTSPGATIRQQRGWSRMTSLLRHSGLMVGDSEVVAEPNPLDGRFAPALLRLGVQKRCSANLVRQRRN